ncbi:MAG: MerR family transcriptional regulator, partial [Actinomycetota bacterium]|nr:MerR family transcriptional regulator [Actinomycetota bacterium]
MEETREGLRLDELAREAGVASTTVRLYQHRGLLRGPRLVGRTGWYDASHLARLRLIGRLQDEGFSLAGIGRLLESWEQGRALSDLVGVERELDQLLGRPAPVLLDPAELAAYFPPGSLTPTLLDRALNAGLVAATDDGRFRVTDPRFVETGAALARLGLPLKAILEEWEHLVVHTDAIAERFLS